MSDGRINERILNGLKHHSEGDDAIREFLLDLVYEEAEHPGHWQWKRTYRARIRDRARERAGGDED